MNFCTDIEKGTKAIRLDKLLFRDLEALLDVLKLLSGGYLRSDEETLALRMKKYLIDKHL